MGPNSCPTLRWLSSQHDLVLSMARACVSGVRARMESKSCDKLLNARGSLSVAFTPGGPSTSSAIDMAVMLRSGIVHVEAVLPVARLLIKQRPCCMTS